MNRTISILLTAAFVAAPGFAFAGGRGDLYVPKGKPVASQSEQTPARTPAPAAARTKYKAQDGKAAPVPAL